MNILIDNAGFKNKGAELMLYSVMFRMKQLYPKGDLVCRAKMPYKIKELYELRTNQKRQWLIPLKIMPSKITKKRFGYVAEQKIDLLLDAGGYLLGDHRARYYNIDMINKWLQFYKNIKNKGGKIIFLPQAFGPFNIESSIRFIESLFYYTDVLFARDQESYMHLTKIFGENCKIKCYPDFTNIYHPIIKEKDTKWLKSFENKICIIPNSKMITHVTASVAEKYIPFMTNLANELKLKNHQVFFLNHEGEGDENLIFDIIERTGQSFDYLTNLDANQIKYIIGKSNLCITSRFHGLVSALSQSVPAFCTSWSHKYLELLKDYQFEEGLLETDKGKESIDKVLSFLSNGEQYEDIKLELSKRAAVQKDLTECMWNEVNKMLGYDY